MTTTNNRVLHAQNSVINGVSAGGLVTASIFEGFDSVVSSPADGLEMPTTDRFMKVVRGSMVSQDWVELLNIIQGTVGTFVFYEQESGATSYLKHTITEPVVHAATLDIPVKGFATCTWQFHCRPVADDDTFADMWTKLPGQAVPTAILSNRAVNITGDCMLASTPIPHVTGVTLNINGGLAVSGNDGALTNSGVDVVWGGNAINGTLTSQDPNITQTLLDAALGDLIIPLTAAKGGLSPHVNQTLTIKQVEFISNDNSSNAGPGYSGQSLNWVGGVSGDKSITTATTNDNVITILDT